ncbi:MAG: CusA/CzcA family heavy metal efflux RND transporter [Methylophaga sp.]|uniref:efflux RND transporter permease subunit n=1 Tax=Methylophaga sp. UBA678 TaxID=1946901 RepID=UPI000C5BD838|nr:CusA/CzcA family heavy metal efflux RND transporter [Methylophaga sp. UBA678]MAX50435.1 CusA/CzcA family heavy metal efflux RND transporter [Methylophaga sp.]|tara:strand:- start:17234 stop:20296 length:3063 start_codon:yes stop_codon:yes gene_type:complete
MDGLIRFSLTQRLMMLILVVVLIGFGWKAFNDTPIDAFPDVSTTQVKIILKAPGMTPEEVESRITALVEVEMLGIPKQRMLRSVVKYGLTDITVDFEEGTDIYWARQQVAERLSAIKDTLPADIQGGLAPLTTPLGEMFMFTVNSPTLDLMQRRELLDWVIRPALRSVEGVADVNSLGGYVKTFEIIPDLAKLAALNISLADIQQALENNNRNDGAGRIDEGEEVLLVRAQGSLQNLDDIKRLVVKSDADEPVLLSQVAECRIGSLTRYGAVSANGQGEAVQGLVLGLRGANAKKVVAGIEKRLAELQASLPDDVSINVFYNRGELVADAIHGVNKALIEAVVLVLVFLLLFLGDLRAAIVVALVLPLSAMITFIMMRQFGLSANLMSLGGLTIAIGMLVDAAVVVVENIVSQLADKSRAAVLPRLHLIYRAVKNVSVPVTSGIIIIVIVFLPLLTLQGLEGKLFIPVALTIVFALAGSLVLSLTVIPVLASFLLKHVSHDEPFLPRVLKRLYAPVLAWSLDHTKSVVMIALLLLAFAAVLYTQVGKAFMPVMDEGDLIVQLEKLPSITLEQSVALDKRVQQALLKNVPEITGVVARTGADELGLDPMGLNETDMFLILKPREQWQVATKEALKLKIRQVLEQFPGLNYGFTQPIEMRVSEMLTGVRGDLAIKIFGEDGDTLNELAKRVVQVVSSIRGAEDVITSQNDGAQYYQIDLNALTLGRLGLSVEEVLPQLRMLIQGSQVGTIYQGARRYPLVIQGERSLQKVVSLFAHARLNVAGNRQVQISDLATLKRVEGPVSIRREQGQRMSVVVANVADRDLVSFVEEAQAAVAKDIDLPSGYQFSWGGQFENQQRAAKRLMVVIPVALSLIFLLLFSTFRSLRQATLVMSNVPFAMVGGITALWLTGEYLSVPASVGFIALLGIAVLNGVVMVSYFNELLETGMAVDDVVREGAMRRLRPVMMTATIAAFGLVPLLFASGPGSEIQRPLAIVVIGGLVSATLLTLVLLPLLFRRFGVAK